MLYYDGIEWVGLSAGSDDDILSLSGGTPYWNSSYTPSMSLSDLNDVSDSLAPSTGDMLYYDGIEWVGISVGSDDDV